MNEDILDEQFQNEQDPLTTVRFAGFWIRLAAICIDVFLFIPIIALNFYNALSVKSFGFFLLLHFVIIAYKPFMEWKFGATVGKMAMKIGVVNRQAQAINWDQSMARFIFFFAYFLVAVINGYTIYQAPGFETIINLEQWVEFKLTHQNELIGQIATYALFFSAIMASFDPMNQALHDKLAKTYCVRVQ